MKFCALAFPCLFALSFYTFAQQKPSPVLATVSDQPRVYITDSNSWEQRGTSAGGVGPAGGGFFSSSAGGARPQTAEVIKTFGQRCPQVLVNNRQTVVDYIVELDHEGGKGLLMHKDKIAVFIRTSGDNIFSKSTLSIGGSVQDACTAITAHWTAHAVELKAAAIAAAAPPPQPIVVQTVASAAPANVASLTVDSSVAGADIEIDGAFVGSTPSTVSIPSGQHTITVKKKGYTDWSRTMNVSGSSVKMNADLDAKP